MRRGAQHKDLRARYMRAQENIAGAYAMMNILITFCEAACVHVYRELKRSANLVRFVNYVRHEQASCEKKLCAVRAV